MTRLFGRAGVIILDTIELVIDPKKPNGALDVSFDVFRTLKPEPNTANVQVWNLNPSHRQQLEERDKDEGIGVSISAGYLEQTSLIFQGEGRTVYTEFEQTDFKTIIQSGDGEKRIQQSRVNLSLNKGATNSQVIGFLANALKVGIGNYDKFVSIVDSKTPLFPQGAVVTGSVAYNLRNILKSLDIEYSIQNGALQFLERGKAFESEAVFLREDTGLIGSPSVDNKGVVTARSLMVPGIFPGQPIAITSRLLQGNFRVETCRYVGDTSGTDWYVDIEATKL